MGRKKKAPPLKLKDILTEYDTAQVDINEHFFIALVRVPFPEKPFKYKYSMDLYFNDNGVYTHLCNVREHSYIHDKCPRDEDTVAFVKKIGASLLKRIYKTRYLIEFVHDKDNAIANDIVSKWFDSKRDAINWVKNFFAWFSPVVSIYLMSAQWDMLNEEYDDPVQEECLDYLFK